ncbi:MAG: leucine-rich repeat domain-containing protein [Muribaculum sp.]|nr:leucine-rich repeat domain-containing protein [Muribaculum sp.]
MRQIPGIDQVECMGERALESTDIDSLVLNSPEFEIVAAGAFSNCKNLKYISLPENVKHMEHSDLSPSLRQIVLHSPYLIGPDKDFYECQDSKIDFNPADVVVLVPQLVIEQYKQSPYWKYFNIQSIE